MSKEKFNPLIEESDDNLIIPEVGIWNEEKYRLLGHYCHVFTSSMRKKWNTLVYIDLFSGSGFSKLKPGGRILRSSALIALSLPVLFDRYIFCEADPVKFDALSDRVSRYASKERVTLLNCNSNDEIAIVNQAIPRYSKQNTTLYFCFADPYDLSLKFSTIKALCEVRKVDFLMLLATAMDGNRNFVNYFQEGNTKIADYLGDPNWRDLFRSKHADGSKFPQFLVDQYRENMISLGYNAPPTMYPIRIPEKNVQLYRLGFFSKHPLGNEFWSEIEKYGDNQLSMF